MESYRFIRVGVVAFLCLVASFCFSQSPEGKQPLRVLYVGGDTGDLKGDDIGPARAADFKQFLESHFTSVKTCKGSEFTPAMADNVDVIVMDARIPDILPVSFRRPMVLVGSNGQYAVGRTGTKIDLLCECLRNKLYDVRVEHAIFRGPLPVKPSLIDEVDPYTGRRKAMWKVHELSQSPGLVSAAENFYQAEDSEIIAGGINTKGDHGAALVREANLFLWGPIASPHTMTEEAKRVLVNTIVYMKQFDGAQQTVWRGRASRLLLQQTLAMKNFRSMSAYKAFESFPPEMVRQFGQDITKYRAEYGPNLGYVYQPHGMTWYVVDKEAQSLGIPNYDIRFLEKCIGLLNTRAEAGKTKALLERYTGKTMPTPAAWQTWFNQNKSNLYFSDSFDYKFYAGPAGPAPRTESVRATIDALNPGEPNDVAPVAAAATVTSYWHSSNSIVLKKGAPAVLVVRLKIAPGWHTYASSSDKHVPYQMTKINVELPTGFRWNGDWQLPASKEGDVPGLAEYRDDIVFTREIYATVASPKIALKGTVQFQTCNAERCLPPDATPFEVTVTVQE